MSNRSFASSAPSVLAVLLALSGLAAFAGGCQTVQKPGAYETFPNDPNRDTEAARKHNAEAVKLIKDDKLDEAEKELKAALTADLMFGPAHNNLGTVYFKQKKYYTAAWEFQYAAKLMVESPQPRINLGLVYENVGRLDEATKWYNEALQLAPDSTEATADLARTCVRQNKKDDRTKELLQDVVMKDSRPCWTAWARQQLSILGVPVTADTPRHTTEPK